MAIQVLTRRNTLPTGESTHRTTDVLHMCGHSETYTLLETGIAADLQENLLEGIDCAECALRSLRDEFELEIDEGYLPSLRSDDTITETAGETARILALNHYIWFLSDVDPWSLMDALDNHDLRWTYLELLRDLINETRPSVWMTVYELGVHQYLMEYLELVPVLNYLDALRP